MTFRLRRTKQCEKCPWRVDVDPNDIPNGYRRDIHESLERTIAEPGAFSVGGTLRIMACHESPVGEEMHCVGWLVNQIGEGNNIPLRIEMMKCENAKDIQLVGEQHQ